MFPVDERAPIIPATIQHTFAVEIIWGVDSRDVAEGGEDVPQFYRRFCERSPAAHPQMNQMFWAFAG